MLPYEYMLDRIRIFDYVLNNEVITSRIASELIDTSINSASNILLRLHGQGWLNRERDKEIVGNRYLYYPSPALEEKFYDYIEIAKERIIENNQED